MHHIQFRKLKTKSKQKIYKDLKHDLQVLLWMFNRFGVSNSNLVFLPFFTNSSSISHEEQWGFQHQHLHQPNFSYLFLIQLMLWLSWVSFLLKLFFFFNGTFFNLWRASPFSSSSNESPRFLLNNFVFPLPPLLVHFVPTRIMLRSQNDECNEDGRNTPLPMPSTFWSCLFTFGTSMALWEQIFLLWKSFDRLHTMQQKEKKQDCSDSRNTQEVMHERKKMCNISSFPNSLHRWKWDFWSNSYDGQKTNIYF